MGKVIKEKGKLRQEFLTDLPKDSHEEVTCKIKSKEWVRVNVRLEEIKEGRDNVIYLCILFVKSSPEGIYFFLFAF